MTNITEWLDDGQLQFQSVGYNQWLIPMSHRYCNYTLMVTNQGNWLSFGADLIGDVRGLDDQEFYRRILALNNKVNGVHIALENGRFVLIRDEPVEDISQYNLYRSLEIFNFGHEYVYQEILNEADNLNVRLS